MSGEFIRFTEGDKIRIRKDGELELIKPESKVREHKAWMGHKGRRLMATETKEWLASRDSWYYPPDVDLITEPSAISEADYHEAIYALCLEPSDG